MKSKLTLLSSRLFGTTCITWFALVAAGLADAPKPIMTLEGGSYVVFSPDGKRLVGSVPGSSRRPSDVKVWKVASGQLLMLLKGHEGKIWQMSFSPDGRFLASNESFAVKVWDLEARSEISSFNTPAFTRSVVFIREGKQLATGHDDGRIILWDAKTSQPVRTLKGHADGCNRLPARVAWRVVKSG